MKHLLLTALILFAWSSSSLASIAFEVEGTLRVEEIFQGPLKLFIETDEGTLELSNVHTPYGNGCTYGRYVVVNNIVPVDTYTLLEMIECLDDTLSGELKDDMLLCPEIWMPVCGQVMLEKRTFGNLCEMKSAEASFKHMGECHK